QEPHEVDATMPFQSAPARSGRHPRQHHGADGQEVSIRARAKRATDLNRGAKTVEEFQSAPARSGRPPTRCTGGGRAVSIRARAKRATAETGAMMLAVEVSIRARAKRATPSATRANCRPSRF